MNTSGLLADAPCMVATYSVRRPTRLARELSFCVTGMLQIHEHLLCGPNGGLELRSMQVVSNAGKCEDLMAFRKKDAGFVRSIQDVD
jgi:hypothetical protein